MFADFAIARKHLLKWHVNVGAKLSAEAWFVSLVREYVQGNANQAYNTGRIGSA